MGPTRTPDPALIEIVANHRLGTLATIRRDGRPQLSTVTYAWDADRALVRVSLTDARAKTNNIRRDARAALHVVTSDGWSYAVVDGAAELTPVAQSADDDTVTELVDLYRSLAGEHDDWDDYRRAMVADRRLVLHLHADSVYGIPSRS